MALLRTITYDGPPTFFSDVGTQVLDVNGQVWEFTDPSWVAVTSTISNTDKTDVMVFGADNTGETDTTTEVQAAIDASPNGIVYLPEGTYKLSGLTFAGEYLDIRGDGKNKTILTIADSNPLLVAEGVYSDPYTVSSITTASVALAEDSTTSTQTRCTEITLSSAITAKRGDIVKIISENPLAGCMRQYFTFSMTGTVTFKITIDGTDTSNLTNSSSASDVTTAINTVTNSLYSITNGCSVTKTTNGSTTTFAVYMGGGGTKGYTSSYTVTRSKVSGTGTMSTSTSSRKARTGQFFSVVEDVTAGTTIRLSGEVFSFDSYTESPQLYLFTKSHFGLHDLTIQVTSDNEVPATDRRLMEIMNFTSTDISGVDIPRYSGRCIVLQGCTNWVVRDCNFYHSLNDTDLSVYGYGVEAQCSANGRMFNCYGHHLRHLYTDNPSEVTTVTGVGDYGRPYNNIISNCNGMGGSNAVFDTHECSFNTLFADCIASRVHRGSNSGGCGFSSRGINISFDNCVADGCYNGWVIMNQDGCHLNACKVINAEQNAVLIQTLNEWSEVTPLNSRFKYENLHLDVTIIKRNVAIDGYRDIKASNVASAVGFNGFEGSINAKIIRYGSFDATGTQPSISLADCSRFKLNIDIDDRNNVYTVAQTAVMLALYGGTYDIENFIFRGTYCPSGGSMTMISPYANNTIVNIDHMAMYGPESASWTGGTGFYPFRLLTENLTGCRFTVEKMRFRGPFIRRIGLGGSGNTTGNPVLIIRDFMYEGYTEIPQMYENWPNGSSYPNISVKMRSRSLGAGFTATELRRVGHTNYISQVLSANTQRLGCLGTQTELSGTPPFTNAAHAMPTPLDEEYTIQLETSSAYTGITLPPVASIGQRLRVVNTSGQAQEIGGVSLANNASRLYMYDVLAGGWRQISADATVSSGTVSTTASEV